MEQWTGSKLGKEYTKAVYCHLAYLTYMQSTSCKMLGWMKHKLESRLPGEISITSDTQGFPGASEVKASAFNAGDPGLIPGLGRSPGEGRKESDMTERLHFHQVLARESQLGNLGQVP